MIALVVGGAASGKSAYAEQCACSLSATRTYLATMANDSPEAAARVEKHRAQRAHAGFATIEARASFTSAAPSTEAAQGVLLVDDVGNLVANALFAPDAAAADAGAAQGETVAQRAERAVARLAAEFEGLARQYAHVVVVGNSVGASSQRFDEATAAWVRAVGGLCCAIAARSDAVVEVVAGLPNVVKSTRKAGAA